ncbi:hypothetical protein [Bacillus cereus]|uniref:Lipoprotein n=1 Tax=Bacillus cereus TaxID=1396 RepID=A0A2B1KUU4_BACCE|nr:hypothetical protein [Bacillus cereus]PFN27792.1 hypothetical protein COJ50_06620 [Bacillus cereus]
MRKSWILFSAILISLSGCGGKEQAEESKPKEQTVTNSEKKQTEESKPKEQTVTNSEKKQTEESKPKEQAVSNDEKKQTEESKPKEQVVTSDVKQQTDQNKPKAQSGSSDIKQNNEESKPKAQTESSGEKSNELHDAIPRDTKEVNIDFEIEKGTNKVVWDIPPIDGLIQLSVGQTIKIHHKNMDPDQPLKVLVSADTFSFDIDEVPHEGRVTMPVEEYTIHATKKGQGTITIAPNADLQLKDELTFNIK